jgi:hypothetical protein
MTHNMAWWILFAVCVMACVGVAMGYWRDRRKSKAMDDLRIEFLRGGPQPPHLQRKDIVSCEGCGCLLHKAQQFEQAGTIAKVEWRNFDGSSAWVNTIIEHYLCLRCQVDGNPPTREMKPC